MMEEDKAATSKAPSAGLSPQNNFIDTYFTSNIARGTPNLWVDTITGDTLCLANLVNRTHEFVGNSATRASGRGGHLY